VSKKILFVCLGNICRSPTAEGVFRQVVENHPSFNGFEIDSCGTSAFHVGEPPDPRSIKAAQARGYNLSTIRSREITLTDFTYFDYILAMDSQNLEQIERLAEQAAKDLVGGAHAKVGLFLQYGTKFNVSEVPDPYYGGKQGFDHVIDLIEDASEGFISQLLSV
jgi:protein-tyrosine phosphatase